MAISRPIVTLTTDFGVGSRYVGAMKGAMLSVNPHLSIVDLTHAIPQGDVRQGAIALDETAVWYPRGTTHVAVIDPGVGTERRILYAEIAGQQFVAPDNGLLSCLAERAWPTRMFVVENREYWLPSSSSTFHGRDIMGPVGAHLAGGLEPSLLGPPTNDLVILPLPEAQRVGQTIVGEVIEVDSFGNLITNITEEMLAEVPRDESVRIVCDDHETFGIFDTYGAQPPMTLIALIGSGKKLELAIVSESAAMMLGVGVGAKVSVLP